MISCKSVAKLVSSDQLASLTWWNRAEVRLHLVFCKYCSRFARQIEQLRGAARRTPDPAEGDPLFERRLEERIIDRLSGKR